MALFALVWAAAGASGTRVPVVVGAVAVAVTALAVALAVRSGSRPPGRPRRLPHDWDHGVGTVNVVQVVAIVAAIAILGTAGVPMLVPPVVCVIVGVHFLPLARLFDQPQYRWTGVLLCLVGVGGLLALALGSGPELSRALVGLSAATVLWGTSLVVARV